jgi:hypothetical protein
MRSYSAGFSFLQFELFVNSRLWQKIETRNHIMIRADAVDTPEPLDEPHRIPVQIVNDDFVTILQIQAFGEYVGGYDGE